MMQRLGLAAAALLGGSLVVLDEVLSGVDPLVSRTMRGRVATLASRGRLVVVASHDLAAVERLATRVLVLCGGALAADVNVAQLLSERVAEISLSGSGLAAVERVVDRFAGAARTGDGLAVPLVGGLTIEQVLTTCRAERVAVAGSRIRYRALEDILLSAAEKNGAGSPGGSGS
jgi:ABC-2 type transport system ATP-binding protein